MSESQTKLSGRLSWDSILFIFLWSAQFWSSEAGGYFLPTPKIGLTLLIHLTRVMSFDPFPTLLLCALAAYLGADLWLSGRKQMNVKLIAVWLTAIAFVFLPTVAAIIYRHNSAPQLYIHDGAIQVEEAIKFLLAGKNPYVESYAGTPLAQWSFIVEGLTVNHALDHLIYLPMMMVMQIPFYLVAQMTLGWYDARMIYLLMLFGAILLGMVVARSPRDKLVMAMLITLNPLFVLPFIEGRNDIVITFWFLAAIVLLQHRRVAWAGICIAMAATSKQTAFIVLPFFLLYVLEIQSPQFNLSRILPRLQRLIPAVLVLLCTIVPFVMWDAGAFYDDVVAYADGKIGVDVYAPTRGLGIGGLLTGLGLIDPQSNPPLLSLIRVSAIGITVLVSLYQQWRQNTLSRMVWGFAVSLAVISFFARGFFDNHLAFVLTWLLIPQFIAEPTDAISPQREKVEL